MGKKKLWSTVSEMKLEETLVGNYAGRLGGFVGLDRDEQLALMNMAREKARYWRTKAEFYHAVRQMVAGVLANYDVPRHRYTNYYAFAEKVARAYAMYPDVVADSYVSAYRMQFSDLDENILYELTLRAMVIGLGARPLYHLQPT